MDEKRRLDLSKYRFERAKEEIDVAKNLVASRHFNTAVSRAYYAVFYSILAATELDGSESAKHSGVISYFNFSYLKTKIFDNIKNITERRKFKFSF